MALNIKNPEVVEAVRALAAQLGTTQTQAVASAVQTELQRVRDQDQTDPQEQRRQRAHAALQRLRQQIPGGPNALRAAERDLYDEQGMWR